MIGTTNANLRYSTVASMISDAVTPISNMLGSSEEPVAERVAALELAIAKMNNIINLVIPVSATSNATGWSGSGSEYTNTINIRGYNNSNVTADDEPEVFYDATQVSSANAEAYAEQCGWIDSIETGENVLLCTAHALPTMDIYIKVKGV